MLDSDLALLSDAVFKPHVVRYAADQDSFFKDFTKASYLRSQTANFFFVWLHKLGARKSPPPPPPNKKKKHVCVAFICVSLERGLL